MTNEAANGNDAQDVTTAEERINDPAAALPTGYEFPAKDDEALKLALFSEGYLLRYNTRAAVIELQRTHLDSSGRALSWKPISRTDGRRASASRIAKTYRYKTWRGSSPLRYGLEAWGEALNALGRRRGG